MINIARHILPIVEPLNLSLITLILGLGFLIWKKRKAGIACISLGICILLVSGYGLFSKQVLYRLENSHAPLDLDRVPLEIRQKVRYVVVLGSGHVSASNLPVTAQINGDSLYRLVEGIRIHRRLPGSKLVISGGKIPGDPMANADVVGSVAHEIGVTGKNIILEKRPRETYEEAKLLQDVLKNKPFVLVTSAAHMQRAVSIFKSFGTRPIPAPTDFILRSEPTQIISSYWPSCGNIGITQRVIYEWLGELWMRLKKTEKSSQ